MYLSFDWFLKGLVLVLVLMPKTSPVHDVDTPSLASPPEVKLVELDLLGAPLVPVLGWLPCVPSALGAPVLPTWPIMEMMQYRHKDTELVVKVTEKENLSLKNRCEKLHVKNWERREILDEFEKIKYQVIETQKEKELFKTKSRRF